MQSLKARIFGPLVGPAFDLRGSRECHRCPSKRCERKAVMSELKALFFDVGGTIFDWKSTARERIQELADGKGVTIDSQSFARDWREEMMKVHGQVRAGNLPWMNSDDMNLRALDSLTERYPLLAAIDRPSLVRAT